MNRTDCTSSNHYRKINPLDFEVCLGKGFDNLTPVQGKVLDFWDIYLPLLLWKILLLRPTVGDFHSWKGHFQLNKVSSNSYLRISQPLKLQSSISPKEISITILSTTSHEQKQALLFKEIHNGVIKIR